MNKIKQALKLLNKHEDYDYYTPEENEALYWKLRDLGEVVDYVEEDANGRSTNYEGVIVKYTHEEEVLYLKLVQEVGKTEWQSDGDYYFSKVTPREVTITEWV